MEEGEEGEEGGDYTEGEEGEMLVTIEEAHEAHGGEVTIRDSIEPASTGEEDVVAREFRIFESEVPTATYGHVEPTINTRGEAAAPALPGITDGYRAPSAALRA